MNKPNIAGQMMVTSYDELLQAVPHDKSGDNPIIELRITDLIPFKNHPFHVVDDEKMQELIESIQQEGVLNPILVRKNQNEKYEIISGHRRKRACELAGLKTIPAIAKELSDSDAINIMVDSNIQRENILPSEKAFAYKMKMEACKKQGSRTDLTSRQNVAKLSTDKMAEEEGISKRQIERYIRLTNLNKNLLERVDQGMIPITAAIELSYIGSEEQNWISNCLSERVGINYKKAARLRKAYKEGNLSPTEVGCILFGRRMDNVGRVVFSNSELAEYFPDVSDAKELKEKVLEFLKENIKESNLQ